MKQYIKLDSRKVTCGEYWNIVHSPAVVIAWALKLFHVPIKFGSGMPYVESTTEFEVPENEFSPQARHSLQPFLDNCLRTGFHSPHYFTYQSLRRETCTSAVTLLHPSGVTVRLTHSVNVNSSRGKTVIALLNELRDGTFLITANQRKQFNSMPGLVAHRLIGAGPQQLFESHRRTLDALPINNPVQPVKSVEMLNELWDRYERKSNDHNLQRGIYVLMTPEEVAAETGVRMI